MKVGRRKEHGRGSRGPERASVAHVQFPVREIALFVHLASVHDTRRHTMGQTRVLQYEAPWPVHCMDWCKSPAPGAQNRLRSAFRLGVSSHIENHDNRIAVLGLHDERVLVEDEYSDFDDFMMLCEAHQTYPATSLQWQPASASSFPWGQKSPSTELLATTGDALRIWEYSCDVPQQISQYVGRAPAGTGHSLALKSMLAGVRHLVPVICARH